MENFGVCVTRGWVGMIQITDLYTDQSGAYVEATAAMWLVF